MKNVRTEIGNQNIITGFFVLYMPLKLLIELLFYENEKYVTIPSTLSAPFPTYVLLVKIYVVKNIYVVNIYF